MKKIRKMPWSMVAVLCLTVGLAPFMPPHIVGKLQMLWNGELSRPIDWFDLGLHGSPWVLAVVKAVVSIGKQSPVSQ